MSKTYRHIKQAEAAKERREYRQQSLASRYASYLEDVGPAANQQPNETHAKHHSDLRFSCHCWRCIAAMRSKHGGSQIRRIRHGERRSIRIALAGGAEIDLTRRVRVPQLSI